MRSGQCSSSVVSIGEERYRFVIHDHDAIYFEDEITLKTTGPNSENTRAVTASQCFLRRLIGTIRRDCLDFIIPLRGSHCEQSEPGTRNTGWCYFTVKVGIFAEHSGRRPDRKTNSVRLDCPFNRWRAASLEICITRAEPGPIPEIRDNRPSRPMRSVSDLS